ncbi:MAG: HesA/MoeB/ThiF family protein [Polycyclovorans sp.]|jgi:molybdopterin/thiamine biosynthesis adenylyltransferase|nr:molybdopterin-synthase adenylyltransferase MoeB [Polycyclovorans sp.]MDP1543625.1 HesA/MoeB/ThiF family protein [Polycyclovorans sp.]|tara:strand:+ start:58390 stop:59121 length:732 start_codon:yes stop_codon:yes gene_type:complete
MTDLHRYSRQIVLPEVGINGQHILSDSTVLLFGMGGLGSASAAYLAGAGVGRLLIADPDRLEASNLQRQVLYREANLGQRKIDAAAAQLTALNAQINVSPLLPDAAMARMAEADVVLDGTDRFSARFAINAACVAARKPLISAAAIRFEGQLAVLDPHRRGGCYACIYPPQGEDAERCEEAGVAGPVVGTVGVMQAWLTLRLLLGLADDAGTLHTWSAERLEWRRMTISRDPSCPVCGHHDPS